MNNVSSLGDTNIYTKWVCIHSNFNLHISNINYALQIQGSYVIKYFNVWSFNHCHNHNSNYSASHEKFILPGNKFSESRVDVFTNIPSVPLIKRMRMDLFSTYIGRVTYIFVSKLCHYWFRYKRTACTAPNHCKRQKRWISIASMHKMSQKLHKIFMLENGLGKVVCKNSGHVISSSMCSL